jgi:hypothetical protein
MLQPLLSNGVGITMLTNKPHGAEYYCSRGNQLCSHSIVSQHFIETDVHCRIHKSSPRVILSQTNPAHTTPSYLSKIHLNIIDPPVTSSLFDPYILSTLFLNTLGVYSSLNVRVQVSCPYRTFFVSRRENRR